MKVYFFPGVGADESLARFHDLPGHEVAWVKWPDRACRDWPGFVEALDRENPIEGGSVFIGISFGGMAALALAQRKKARGVILISSCRDSGSVSPMLRIFKPLVRHLPLFLFRMDLMPRWLAGWFFGVQERDHLDLLFEMGRKLEAVRFRAINALALEFSGGEPMGIPVRSIHGARDRMIRADAEPRDVVIPDGGHLISTTHSEAVNRALREWIGGFSRG
jgi:pimeloyl-ACP methyl ester carboxylesterase